MDYLENQHTRSNVYSDRYFSLLEQPWNSRRKGVIFIVVTLVFCAVLLAYSASLPLTDYFGQSSRILSRYEFATESVASTMSIPSDYIVYTTKCRIRNYNYSEPSILKEYFNGQPPKCPENSKPFIFIPKLDVENGQSCVGIDNVTVKTFYADFDQWNCSYGEVVRAGTLLDKRNDVINEQPLQIGQCLKKEFIWIKCKLPSNSGEIYEQPLMLPFVKSVEWPIVPNNQKKKPLNVLILGMDSVSRLNAHRQFRKTLEFLNAKKNFIELFGYNKIGMNSQPNQIPLLSGIQFDPKPGLIERIENNYFDNLTRYVWEDYEERGYRTMFYEDFTPFGLFVYGSLYGFKKQPTTYYPRAMWSLIDRSELKRKGKGWCIGNHFPTKHYLDYTFNTMKILGTDRPLFSYSWLVEVAHDNLNGAQAADGYFLDFFQKMEADGILQNTAVFFISDHGFRFGSYRETKLGEYEDILPFGFVLMPDWFYEANPDALRNMEANSRQLVTVYDLHATLLELADVWSERRTTRTAYGYSLLSNVIPDRNCRDAHIGFQFCSCFEQQTLNASSELSKSLANAMINEMNSIIANNNATTKCQQWSIDSVEKFSELREGTHSSNFYKISIKTKPKAQFNVSAQLKNSTWSFLAKIDRIDWFSSNAKCVKGNNFERYCYCNT